MARVGSIPPCCSLHRSTESINSILAWSFSFMTGLNDCLLQKRNRLWPASIEMVTAAGTCIVCCSLEGFRERVSAPSSRGGGDLNGCLRALMRARKSHRFLRISRNGSKSPDKYDSPLPLTFFSHSVPTVAMQIEAAPRPLFDSTV